MQMTYLIGRLDGLEMGGNSIRAYSELRCSGYEHDRFVKAADMLVKSNEMLRCAIYQDGTQEILDCSLRDIPFNKLDITESEAEGYIEKRRSEIFDMQFDLEKPPLIYFEVTGFSDGNAVIHLYHDCIVVDGWSHEMIIRELDEFYCGRRTEPLKLGYTYRQYVQDMNEKKKSRRYKECRDFWLEQTASFPGSPDLRSRNRAETNTETFMQVTRSISKDEYEMIKKNSFSRHLSPFAVLLTAYGKSISKYSSEHPFLLNIPMSARNPKIPDMQYTIGEYSDFLIYDWTEERSESFMDCVYRVQERLFELIENRDFSGIEVVQEMQKQREGALIAPVVFTSTLDIPYKKSEKLEKIYSKTHTSQVWLDSIVMYTQDAVLLTMDYVEEKTGTDTINQVADSFISLIKQFAAEPESWNDIYCIPLTDDEKALSEQNFVPAEINDNFGALMRNSFVKHRDKPAVISNAAVITYRQVQNFAGVLYERITELCGTERPLRIGLLLEKGWKQTASEAACLITNMTFVPVEKENSDTMLLKMFENLDISCLVTEHEYADKWRETAEFPVIDVSGISYDKDFGSEIFIAENRCDECYCIHSSGTTGQPKAIMLNEKGLVNCILQTNKEFNINENDRCIAVTNFCHDMSVYDTAGILIAGGTVVIPEGREEEKNPEVWLELIKKHKVTVWNGSPSVMEMLMTEKQGLSAVKGQFKVVMLGGEVFTPSLARQIRDILNPSYLYNVGGPAEATLWSIWHRVTDEDMQGDMIPYGHALNGLKYRVLDELHHNCPPGTEGIMYISGAGLAVGYHNLPDMTAERFVTIDNERWYDTGDIGWYMQDGEIAFGGRKDLQVEINGKRVELEGIAAVLMEQGDITRCVAVLSGRSRLLTAFYSSEKDIPSGILEKFADENLPQYMRPAHYVRLDAFPITPNGKTDLKKLREYECKDTGSVKAVTETEIKLRNICRSVISENFILEKSLYQNGGNSISVIKLANRIRTEFGVKTTVAELLKSPYFSEWTKLIDAGASEEIHNGRTDNQANCYPLSPEQQDMWIYDNIHRNTRYVISAKLEIKEEIDAAKLNCAIKSVLTEEPVLRAVFRMNGGGKLEQIIQPDTADECLQVMKPGNRETAEFIINSLADMPMELDKGPLYRFMLFDCADGYRVFMMTLHHIISDEQSFGIVYRKILDKYYNQERAQTGSADFFSYISDSISKKDNICPEWELLKDAEAAENIYMPEELKTDRSLLERDFVFDEAAYNNLRRICAEENVSFFSGLLVLFTELISEISEQEYIWVSVPSSDRASGAYEDTVGMFVKKLIVRMPANMGNFREALHTAQKALLEAASQSGSSFRDFVRRNNLSQKLNAIYSDMVLNLIDSGDNSGYGAFDYVRNKAESNATKLQLMADINENARIYRFYYDKEFFGDDEMTFITETWQKILRNTENMF